jgi:hypothetical protein
MNWGLRVKAVGGQGHDATAAWWKEGQLLFHGPISRRGADPSTPETRGDTGLHIAIFGATHRRLVLV